MTESEIRQSVINCASKYIGISGTNNGHKIFVDRFNTFIKSNDKKIADLPRKTVMDLKWAWCACFASSIAIEMGYAMEIIPVEMSCCKMIQMWKQMKKADGTSCWQENDAYTPQTGDYIYFDWDGSTSTDSVGVSTTDHVGIVEYVKDGYIHTIEGNRNNKVMRKSYKINHASISGFGLPDFASLADKNESTTTPNTIATTSDVKKVSITAKQLKLGNKGKEVLALQSLLNGINSAYLSLDSSFGSKTQAAVKSYQAKKGLDVDGIVGAKTWNSLING